MKKLNHILFVACLILIGSTSKNFILKKQLNLSRKRTIIEELKDRGESLINFKKAARPYLLTTPEKDRKYKIQKVKTGIEEFDKIKDIKINSDGKKAIVSNKIIWHNNIFASLRYNPSITKKERKAYFIITQKWMNFCECPRF